MATCITPAKPIDIAPNVAVSPTIYQVVTLKYNRKFFKITEKKLGVVSQVVLFNSAV